MPAGTAQKGNIMTVQNQNVKNVYRGNGSTTVFPFTFAINEDHPEYLHVYITDDGGKAVETTDFTYDMEARTVTYPKPSSTAAKLSATQRLTIYRVLPYTQGLNLVNQGPFFSEDVEKSLDDLEMQIQQLNEEKGRSLRVGLDVEDFDTTIPLQPGKTFRVNDEGTGFELTEDPAVAHAAAEAAKDAAEEAQEKAETAQGKAEDARDDAEAAYNLIKENAAWFDNVAAMRAAIGLAVGMTAGTKGYYAINDGGGAVYNIRVATSTDTSDIDGGLIILLNKGLVAELITDTTYNIRQFGCKGDGVTDDTVAFKKAIRTSKKTYVPQGTYLMDFTNLNLVNTNIVGASRRYSVIKQKNKNVAFGRVREHAVIENLTFVTTNNTEPTDVLTFGYGVNSATSDPPAYRSFEDCNIEKINFTCDDFTIPLHFNIQFGGSAGGIVHDILINGCYKGVLVILLLPIMG